MEGISSFAGLRILEAYKATSQRCGESPRSVMQRGSRLSSRTRAPKVEDLRKYQVCRWTNEKKMVSTELSCMQTKWLAVSQSSIGIAGVGLARRVNAINSWQAWPRLRQGANDEMDSFCSNLSTTLLCMEAFTAYYPAPKLHLH